MYKEQEIYQGLIDRGMSPHVAAGFTGNFVAESGLDTNIYGDNNTSYGLAQWHNKRKEVLNNFSKGKKGSPLDIQLDFVMHELATTHKGVANRLKSAKNVDDASKIVTLYYEVPLDREKKANERLVHSRKVFSGGGGDYKPQKEEEEVNPYTIDFGNSQVAKNSGDTYSVADYNEAEQEIEKKQTQENNENAFLSEMQQIQQNSQQQPMPNEPQQTYLQDSSLFQVGEFQKGGTKKSIYTTAEENLLKKYIEPVNQRAEKRAMKQGVNTGIHNGALDAIRHSSSAAAMSSIIPSWANLIPGVAPINIGLTNLAGAIHEYNSPNDLKENTSDLYNNFIGSVVGVLPISENEKHNLLIDAQKYGILSDLGDKHQKGGMFLNQDGYLKRVIEDDRGQWSHPGEITRINGGNITMQGVSYPVIGVSDKGEQKMMYPNKNYRFNNANYVTEFPQNKK